MFLKIKKIVGLGAGLIFVVAWFAYGLLESSFVRNSPRSPNPEEGRTVPYSVKSIVVYITKEEQHLMRQLIWIGIGSAIVVALVLLVHGGDPFKSKE
jgi:hypothetical protein